MSAIDEALDLDELDARFYDKESKDVVEAEKQCRIMLSPTAEHAIRLEWNPGGRSGRKSIITVEPGKSVVQPLAKCMVWFGPFIVPHEYNNTTDERRKEELKKFWSEEKRRYLDRYDYPRPTRGGTMSAGMEPTGPHRSPNVIVTVIDSDGTEQPSIILHKLYKIGEYDDRYPLSSFGLTEAADDVKARYEAELESMKSEYTAQMEAHRREMAELRGVVLGKQLAAGAK